MPTLQQPIGCLLVLMHLASMSPMFNILWTSSQLRLLNSTEMGRPSICGLRETVALVVSRSANAYLSVIKNLSLVINSGLESEMPQWMDMFVSTDKK
ncbi:hypothetical protein BLOT_003217 [Blomia tropicalis]|nr:hypothetical protein BLOT_003217 [Blomia tropicalis]